MRLARLVDGTMPMRYEMQRAGRLSPGRRGSAPGSFREPNPPCYLRASQPVWLVTTAAASPLVRPPALWGKLPLVAVSCIRTGEEETDDEEEEEKEKE